MDLVSADSKVLVVPWRAREVLDKRAAVFFAEKKGWGKSYIKAVYIQYILDIYIYMYCMYMFVYVYSTVCICLGINVYYVYFNVCIRIYLHILVFF